MKFIAGELLKLEGKTLKDLEEVLKPNGPSYRTLYEYFKRGGGSLEIGAKIACGMGRTLNDIYVNDDYAIPDISEKMISEGTVSSIADVKNVLEALINFDDESEYQRGRAKLGKKMLYDWVELCDHIRNEHKINQGIGGEDGKE